MDIFNFEDNLVDTHIHLNDSIYDEDRGDVIKRAIESGIKKIIDISVDLSSSIKSINLAKNFPEIRSAVGIDPEICIPGSSLYKAKWDLKSDLNQLEELIIDNKEFIELIGETGIDNYWIQIDKQLTQKEKDKCLELQRELFLSHIKLAEKYDLPLSIHSRGAVDECINLLNSSKVKGIFHSLTNDRPEEELFYRQVSEILESGNWIGVNGIVTYNSAGLIQGVYRKVYIERFKAGALNPQFKSGSLNHLEMSNEEFLKSLYEVGFVLETDGPYLLPRGYEGKVKRRNEPNSIVTTLEFLKKLFLE